MFSVGQVLAVRTGVAKCIIANQMWFVTRRVMWREMRLRPSPKLNKVFSYVVFKVAATYKVRISALCVMANHWHAVLGAEERNLPAFLQALHSELARAINAAHGDFGALWDKSDEGYDALPDERSVLAAICYTMNNPVTSGGVRFARNWPGVRLAWPAKERTFERARPFYRTKDEGGETPATVVRKLERPFGFVGVTDEKLAQRIGDLCEEGEKRAIDRVFEKGGRFRKRSEVVRMSRYSRAKSFERHFDVRRRIKGRDPKERMKRIALKKQWDAEYAAALSSWRAGDRSVLFPYGTYQMVVLHGVEMAPPPNACA